MLSGYQFGELELLILVSFSLFESCTKLQKLDRVSFQSVLDVTLCHQIIPLEILSSYTQYPYDNITHYRSI
jgi:hypothetical protein